MITVGPDAILDFFLIPWVWCPLGIGMAVLTWWGARQFRSRWLAPFLTSFVIALFFTPFIPHRSVEWSTPWPPAVVWVAIDYSHGAVNVFETVSIGLVTVVLGTCALLSCRFTTRKKEK